MFRRMAYRRPRCRWRWHYSARRYSRAGHSTTCAKRYKRPQSAAAEVVQVDVVLVAVRAAAEVAVAAGAVGAVEAVKRRFKLGSDHNDFNSNRRGTVMPTRSNGIGDCRIFTTATF